jgi:hypothetical protein
MAAGAGGGGHLYKMQTTDHLLHGVPANGAFIVYESFNRPAALADGG